MFVILSLWYGVRHNPFGRDKMSKENRCMVSYVCTIERRTPAEDKENVNIESPKLNYSKFDFCFIPELSQTKINRSDLLYFIYLLFLSLFDWGTQRPSFRMLSKFKILSVLNSGSNLLRHSLIYYLNEKVMLFPFSFQLLLNFYEIILLAHALLFSWPQLEKCVIGFKKDFKRWSFHW